MAWFRLTNNAGVPVNAALSWADFNEFKANDIAPRHTDANGNPQSGYAEWDVGGAAWHSLTAVVSNGKNQFGSNNAEAISEWVIGSLGVIGTAAGIILIPFTGGLSTAMTAAGAAALATAVGGAVVTVADVVFAGVEFALKPVTIGNLYAPHGYNFTFSGGDVVYKQDENDPNKIIVTGFTPLTVGWHNNETGSHGTVTE